MKRFYGREKELSTLKRIEKQSESSATFTVLMGRRRVGKTELTKRIMDNSEHSCYLFTSKVAEPLLALSWQEDIFNNLGLRIPGKIDNLKDLFKELFIYSEENHFTLVIDEYQEIEKINKAFFSEFQNLWDTYKNKSKMNLIVCGSVYSLMVKIFENAKEPLFSRCNLKMTLKPLPPSVIKEILSDYYPKYTNEDLLCLYMLTGGVPRYISLLMDGGVYTKDEMIEFAVSPSSPFLTDAKDILISEIGNDYSIYFSILMLIADGYTTQSEIDSVVGKNTGSYIEKLESVFKFIKKNKPLFAPENSRKTHYEIDDQYIKFYFRFIYSNLVLIELEQYDRLKEIVMRDYETYTGKTLERYFFESMKEKGGFTLLGPYWDRKGENEIDLLSLDSFDKTCHIYEIKRNKEKYNEEKLAKKAEKFSENIPGYKIDLIGLSISDM